MAVGVFSLLQLGPRIRELGPIRETIVRQLKGQSEPALLHFEIGLDLNGVRDFRLHSSAWRRHSRIFSLSFWSIAPLRKREPRPNRRKGGARGNPHGEIFRKGGFSARYLRPHWLTRT